MGTITQYLEVNYFVVSERLLSSHHHPYPCLRVPLLDQEEPTHHEVQLLKTQLQQWCKLNEFDVRIFKIFRNVIKYGDQVFVRDPENFKLYWVDMVKVIKVIVNESEGKKPEQYVLKDLNINLQDLSVAQKTNTDFAANPATGLGGTGGGTNTPYTVPAMPYNTSGSRFTLGQSESAIDAKHELIDINDPLRVARSYFSYQLELNDKLREQP